MAPTIETRRLLIRPWRNDDLDPWSAMCADERVMRFLGPTIDRKRALADATMLADRLEERGYGWWVIEVKGVVSFIGLVALQTVPFQAPFTPALEVGWRLAAQHWGNGYATEAARAALDFAFQELGRIEVLAMTSAINFNSQKVMQRLEMSSDPADNFNYPFAASDELRPYVLYRKKSIALVKKTSLLGDTNRESANNKSTCAVSQGPVSGLCQRS